MAVVAAGPGTASFGLFALAGVARIADIAATDGTTRTSINAAYQVVPVEERLAVQAVVEGIGVPVAIGATGVLLLALDALDLGVGAVIVFGLVLAVTWTAVAVGVYRSYTRALADEMRRRPLVGERGLDVPAEDDVPAVGALLRSEDARDVRLGLDLLAGVGLRRSRTVELRRVAEHADPEVRVRALGQLAASGDVGRPPTPRRSRASSPAPATPTERRAAAAALARRRVVAEDRAVLVALLDDPDASVRGDGARCGRAPPTPPTRRSSAASSRPSRSRVPRAGRPRRSARLGDAAVPFLARRARPRGRAPARVRSCEPRRRRRTGARGRDRRTGARRSRPLRWCSPRSTPSTRPAAAASSRRMSSTACSGTPPPSRRAPSPPGPRSPRATVR